MLQLVLFATSLLSACSSLSTKDPMAISAYQEARNAEKKGVQNWSKAIRYYRKSLEYDHRFLEAHLALGRIYSERGQLHKAAAQYHSALMANPNRKDLYLHCGKALFFAEQYQEALIYLQQYHAFVPQDADGLYWLAETERAMNSPLAEEYFFQLIRTDSTKTDYWQSLANFYFYRKDYAQAAQAYARAIRLTKNPPAQVLLDYGYCLIQLRQWHEAKNVLEKAAKSAGSPSRAKEYYEIVTKIALGYFKADAFLNYLDGIRLLEEIKNDQSRRADYPVVYEYLRTAVKTEPDFISAHQELADVCYTLGKDEEALASYRIVISAGKASADHYANAAYLLFRKDQYEPALSYYEKSLQLKPDQPSVEKSIRTVKQLLSGERKKEAYFYFDRGVSSESADSAILYLQKATELDTLYAEAYLQLGIRQKNAGQWREAEKSYLRGVRCTKETNLLSLFHYHLARLYSRRDYHDRAIAHYDSALIYRPDYDDALYELAKVYSDKSDLASAIRHYDRLIQRNPNYFRPDENDFKSVGVNPTDYIETSEKIDFSGRMVIGQKNRYRLKIQSKNDGLLGADANNDLSREVTIVFTEQVLDTTSYGVTEFAVEIESIEGYALTPMEKKAAGKVYYLRISDVFGVVNIYGLIEENPYSIQRLVMHTLEDLHSGRLRKPLAEGELWRGRQYIFKMGHIDGVVVFEETDDHNAYGKKYYNIFGSYDAAKYGETGRIYVQLDGKASFTFDRKRQIIRSYKNDFVTKTFNENTAKLEVQSGAYELQLLKTEYEKIAPPHRVVIADVPYIKQHGPQCAAASLSMILAFYKDTIDQDSIYSAIKSDFAGAQSHDILHYPRSLGRYKSYGYIGTLEDLKDRIDQNLPVIVFLSPYGYGHVVVVIGYDETRHQIIMHDPTIADHHAVGYDDFLIEWRQSGNECALVVPFNHPMNVTDGAMATHKAVEIKWYADKLFSKRQYDEALSRYRDALAIKSDYEGALEGILMVYLSKDRFDEASALLDTLMAMNPGSVELILRNASLLLSQYDYDKVLQLTQKIKQLDESNILNYLYSASALFSQKKIDEAINELRKAINLNPLVSTPRNMLSGYLAEKGEYEQAYEQAKLSIRYEPENVGNYLNLAGIYQAEVRNRFLNGLLRAQKLQSAIDAIKQTEAINPQLPNLDLYYADVYAEMENYALADSLFLENIRKYPDENTAYNNLAWHWASRGIRLREAEQYSQKSIELSKRNPYYFDTMAWIHFKIAMEYQKAGKKDSAEIYFRKAESELKETIAFDMYSDFAYRHLGVVYERWGFKNLARAQYDIVLGLMPDKARTYVEVAQDCEEAELYESAIEFYQKALNLQPSLDYAAFRLAYLYIKTGRNPKDAMIFAQSALEADRYNFNYIGIKGVVYWAMKDYEQARGLLEEAIQMKDGYYDIFAQSLHYYLGRVYQALNQKQKSYEQYRLYLQKDPYGNYIHEVKNIIK